MHSTTIDARLAELAALPQGWDADGEAPPPNGAAIADARAMLEALAREGAKVDEIDADALGGIALHFYTGGRTLWIACHNHGSVVAVGRDRSAENKALATRAGPHDSAGLAAWLAGGHWPSPPAPPSDTLPR